MLKSSRWIKEQAESNRLLEPFVATSVRSGVISYGLGPYGYDLRLLHEKTGISRLRGQWRLFRGIPVMPTYHPAYLLRNQALAEKRKVWEDMLQVMEKLGLPISEKQRGYFLRA